MNSKIHFFDRLSFRQVKYTILIALGLGLLLTVMQIGLDYFYERKSIKIQMQTIMSVYEQSAARIAYNLNHTLAQEFVDGLTKYPAITHAEIIDDGGQNLAVSFKAKTRNSSWLHKLWGSEEVYRQPLKLGTIEQSLGEMTIKVDPFIATANFRQRAGLLFISGFIRSFILLHRKVGFL